MQICGSMHDVNHVISKLYVHFYVYYRIIFPFFLLAFIRCIIYFVIFSSITRVIILQNTTIRDGRKYQ